MENKKQLLKECQYTTMITAKGESEKEVIGKIFQLMRKQIFKEIEYPIIHLEANEVYFKKVDIEEVTEKFLFFFMPRTKSYFTITAEIVVMVKYLDFIKEES